MIKNKLNILTLFIILFTGNLLAQKTESVMKSTFPDLYGKYKIEETSVYDVSQKIIYSDLYKKLEDGFEEICLFENNNATDANFLIFTYKDLKNLNKETKLPDLKVLIKEQELLISKYMFGKEKYGADSLKCVKYLSLFAEYLNQNNMAEAYNSWTVLFNEFPLASKNIYIKGNDILSPKIESAVDDAEKEKWIDTLMLMYDQRILFFDDSGKFGKGYVLGKKGVDLFKYRKSTKYEEAYKILMESVELQKDESELAVIFTTMKAVYANFTYKKIDCSTVVDNYLTFRDILENQLKSAISTGNTLVSSNISKTIEGVDQFFIKTGCATCEKLVETFSPQFSHSPNDVELMKKIIAAFSSQKCDTSELFEKVSESLYIIEPSEVAAYNLGTIKLKLEKSSEALEYFEKAIEFCIIDSIKATYYYKAGIIATTLNLINKSIYYAKEAIKLNNNYGEPYILLGISYSYLISSCGDAFEQSAANWVIVDKLLIAKTKDSSLSEKIDLLISSYSDKYPDKSEAVSKGIYEGSLYKVDCLEETTSVRF